MLRVLLLCLFVQFSGVDMVFAGSIKKVVSPKAVKEKYFDISPDDVAAPAENNLKISEFDVAMEAAKEVKTANLPDNGPSAVKIDPAMLARFGMPSSSTKDSTQEKSAITISPDDVAVTSVAAVEPEKILPYNDKGPDLKNKSTAGKIADYARNFWYEDDEGEEKPRISISGTKSFEMKKADVSGDIGHFSTENYDSMPGFHLDQSLHLEIDGNITDNSTVHAVLDDKDDEDRRFTINIDGPVWDFIMGDFPLDFDGTEFTLYRKEVRGVLAKGSFHKNFQSAFLFSQSKGLSRREQFRGAGQQQEFRLGGNPIVQNSEKVSIDGKPLTRGTDYFVDYEDGIIKFLPHMLPIELTRWIVVEYEVNDDSMAFSRKLFGTRQVYTRDENRQVGFSWLREVDDTTPKSAENASSTATPMQHDVIGMDTKWQINKNLKMDAESSISLYDPNIKTELTAADKRQVGHATKVSLLSKTARTDGELTFKRIDHKFKVVGRESGVTELGERGLVNDILSGKARLTYKINEAMSVFADSERSETNLSDDPAISTIDFSENNAGAVWAYKPDSRIEVRAGTQHDLEKRTGYKADINRDDGAVIWDSRIGNINTQAKLQRTAYIDRLNAASDSSVLEANLSLGSEVSSKFSWNVGASRIAVDDELVPDNLRSETQNYSMDLNYEPNRVFTARGVFQWRRADDFLANSRTNTEIADSRLKYEPTRDLRTQFKYKVENTSKVLRDPNLDPEKYILPPSLPQSETQKEQIIGTFENPVQKTDANFTTDYQINKYLQAYFDWRNRQLRDQATKISVSSNDRQTFELRYVPMKKMLVTTEYESGVSKNYEPKTELKDSLKSIQVRHEFYEGCILDATVEERDEDDVFINENDTNTKSKILEFQRAFNRWATLELGLQHNKIASKLPSTEWEKRMAVILTPFSRSQRYKFYINHKDISAAQSGSHYEGGMNFSQFIGTDTIIDGEIKKVHSSPGIAGSGYDAFVVNAKMVITF